MMNSPNPDQERVPRKDELQISFYDGSSEGSEETIPRTDGFQEICAVVSDEDSYEGIPWINQFQENLSNAPDDDSDDLEATLLPRDLFLQRFGAVWDLEEWQSRWDPRQLNFRCFGALRLRGSRKSQIIAKVLFPV
jgi:hypothetical protein